MAKGRMPEGVHPPWYVARSLDLKKHVGVVAANTYAEEVPNAAYRKQLLSAVRKGDPSAIKRLQQEFRCRIWYEHDV